MEAKTFKEVLNEYVAESRYSAGQIAELSGLPKRTVVNWLSGRVKKPQTWHGIIAVAKVLRLEIGQTSRLLTSAGHPEIHELTTSVEQEELHFLEPWLPASSKPFNVIPQLPYFTGRQKELQQLKEYLLGCPEEKIVTIQGMGGVGKSSLAAKFAHEYRLFFPDGIIWVRVNATTIGNVLNLIATLLGENVTHYTDNYSKATLLRDFLAKKCLLLILDNVETTEEIEHLLPNSASKSSLLVTTRNYLSICQQGPTIRLLPFEKKSLDSVNLFKSFLPANFVRGHKKSLKRLSDSVGYLPIAIVGAASQLTMSDEPAKRLDDLLKSVFAAKLNSVSHDKNNIHNLLELTYYDLPSRFLLTFKSLGLFQENYIHPDVVGELLSEFQLAAVTDEALQYFERISLLLRDDVNNYYLHPLVHDFAISKLSGHHDLYAMFIRYYDLYVNQHAMNNSEISKEIPNIYNALTFAEQLLAYKQYVNLAKGLYRYLRSNGLFEEAQVIYEKAIRFAELLEDHNSQALFYAHLGDFYNQQGEREKAEEALLQAEAVALNFGNLDALLDVKNLVGAIAHARGEYEKAKEYWEICYNEVSKLNQKRREAIYCINLGAIETNLGNLHKAHTLHKQTLEIARDFDDPELLALIYSNMAEQESDMGLWEDAFEHIEAGIDVAKTYELENRLAWLYKTKGALLIGLNKFHEAEICLHDSISLSARTQFMKLQGISLAVLAELYSETNEALKAMDSLKKAFELATKLNHQHTMLAVLYSGAKVYINLGNVKKASEYNSQVHQLATALPSRKYLIDSLVITSIIFFQESKYPDAEEKLCEALVLAENLILPEVIAQINYYLSEIYRHQGDLNAASELIDKSITSLSTVHKNHKDIAGYIKKQKNLRSMMFSQY